MVTRVKQYTLTVDGDNATLALIPPAVVPPQVMASFLQYRGCNLTGGGTAWNRWADLASPGPVDGTHYKFVSGAEVDGLVAAGMNTFRLLFTWEAVQTKPYEALGSNGAPTYWMYWNRFVTLVDYITQTKGCDVILDIHGDIDAGFAAYRSVRVGGSYAGVPVSDMLRDLWGKLAFKYASNPRVHYGITNEPHDITPSTWYDCAQLCINAIRSVGGKGTIFMPGCNWTGAGSWMTSNAQYWKLTDPLNNLQVQLHLYFDANSGGGTTDVASVTIGVERLKDAVTWARQKGLKLFLGEVGLSAASPNGTAAWGNLHTFMLANRDVCSGFAFWACGPASWWSGYQFYCGVGSPQLAMIQSALK